MSSTSYVLDFLWALGVTLSTELVVLLLLLKTVFKKNPVKIKLVLFAGIAPTMATLPYLWFVLSKWIPSYTGYLITGEILVVLIEAIFYLMILNINIRKALMISLLCNATSFALGLLIQ